MLGTKVGLVFNQIFKVGIQLVLSSYAAHDHKHPYDAD